MATEHEALALPGFVDVHSRTFERSLRGSGWGERRADREARVRAAALGHTPASVRLEYVRVYREMRAAGFTAVGEFHLLGEGEALAAAEAAAAAGVELVLFPVARPRSGPGPAAQPSPAAHLQLLERLRGHGLRVGVAPHSVVACPRDWLEALGAYAVAERLPLQVVACAEPEEVAACLAEHGLRPLELLDATGCLGPHSTVVHATLATGAELDLVARSGATLCACPTAEAALGYGFLPVERVVHRSVPLCIGTASNTRLDPLEELRELEGTARRQAGRPGVLSPAGLLEIGSAAGARALGLRRWPGLQVAAGHPALHGVPKADRLAALLLSCSAGVLEPAAG